jgi:molybdenum cofactor biosynthesis protein B
VGHHHARDRVGVACAVITVSDTRTAADDTSGAVIRDALEAAGHRVVVSTIVADDATAIRAAVADATSRADVGAVLLTGGTGVAPRDVTPESLDTLWTMRLPGFGETFRALSFAEIGPAALLSRATAGMIDGRFVAALPGSPAGCRLAVERLIAPVLGHVTGLTERR